MTQSIPHVRGALRVAMLDAWAVLSPVTCAGCGADDRMLCAACLLSLTPRPQLQLVATPGSVGLSVTSALQYDGCVRQAILALKERSRTDVARILGWPLRASIAAAIDGEVELVSVPPSRASFRARGFDPVALLLAGAGMPHSPRLLHHIRSTAQQKSLDREHRESNLSFSLRARYPLEGRRFLIVDDVVTTGATLIEAARAITAASGEVVGAATLAYTAKRLEPSPWPAKLKSRVDTEFRVNGE